MNYKIGFIGCGAMGQAMLSAILQQGAIKKEEIIVSAKTIETITKIKNQFDVNVTFDNMEVAQADIVIVAVKSHLYEKVCKDIAPFIRKEAIVVSITTSHTLSDLEAMLVRGVKVVRAMPNTPAVIQEGMSALCASESLLDEDMKLIADVFSSFGSIAWIAEDQMSGFIALAGSSPAYFMIMLEAMGDAGVKLGIPRKEAYAFAAQAMLGSAKLFLTSNQHPAQLKDQVTSVRGTTIEAVCQLEQSGFRTAIIEAMVACAKKNEAN
ncbi:MAG: pyrroline-5-carboxylate reductase [Erysipelotrichaceae bacterium]